MDKNTLLEEPIRLSKRMTELGLCSRREADEYIAKGWVTVDGIIINTLGTKILPSQKINLNKAAQNKQDHRLTVILNKPLGYVSAQAEHGYQPASTLITQANYHTRNATSASTFRHLQTQGLAPAGRLDIDSTGLLIFTQDGRIAKQIIGENTDIEKEYLVRVEGDIHPKGLKLLNYGLSLDDKMLRQANVRWQSFQLLNFILKEGKKRQIRRMCELVGLRVVSLKRIRIGHIHLADLPIGKWRYLNTNEKSFFYGD